MNGPRRVGRKLLIASLGVATVSYVGCGVTRTFDAAVDTAPADAGAERPDGPANDNGSPSDARDAADDRQFTGNLVPYY